MPRNPVAECDTSRKSKVKRSHAPVDDTRRVSGRYPRRDPKRTVLSSFPQIRGHRTVHVFAAYDGVGPRRHADTQLEVLPLHLSHTLPTVATQRTAKYTWDVAIPVRICSCHAQGVPTMNPLRRPAVPRVPDAVIPTPVVVANLTHIWVDDRMPVRMPLIR